MLLVFNNKISGTNRKSIFYSGKAYFYGSTDNTKETNKTFLLDHSVVSLIFMDVSRGKPDKDSLKRGK
jgi:hypothetical protein